ncbi:MAG: hypothetical protein AAGK00_17985 [Pseudomonadota bacterium]
MSDEKDSKAQELKDQALDEAAGGVDTGMIVLTGTGGHHSGSNADIELTGTGGQTQTSHSSGNITLVGTGGANTTNLDSAKISKITRPKR